MGKASKSSRKASKAEDEQTPEQEMAVAAGGEREECFLCQQPSDGKRCSDCGIAQAGNHTLDYRVGLVVWQLGWIDLDLECSTILLGQ